MSEELRAGTCAWPRRYGAFLRVRHVGRAVAPKASRVNQPVLLHKLKGRCHLWAGGDFKQLTRLELRPLVLRKPGLDFRYRGVRLGANGLGADVLRGASNSAPRRNGARDDARVVFDVLLQLRHLQASLC